MAFNDLLSSSFLFSIAIIIILIGGIFAYVSYRMSEQDHKMTSMLGLISTMAEELHFFRNKLSKSQHVEQEQMEQTNLDLDRVHIILDPNNLVVVPDLISVSDEEEDEDEEEEDEEDEDEDDDDEDDDEDESDEEEDGEEVDLDENVIDLDDTDIINMDNMDNIEKINNIKSIHLEEPINLNYTSQDFKDLDLDHSDEHLTNEFKSISISDLEDTNKKTDYKKMSLNKLREVVVEKSIVVDASKLKKHDLLKLLGE